LQQSDSNRGAVVTFIWRTITKDFQRQRRRPAEFAIWLGVPLLIGGLMVAVSGGRSGPKPQAHVLVADQDQSFLSELLVGAASQDATGSVMRAESVELEDGRRRVENGEATALLIIPEGFSDAVLLEEPSTLQLVTNPAQRILPGIVEESLSILLDANFYAHRVLGEDLAKFAGGPSDPDAFTFSDQTIADFGVRVNQLVERLGKYLSPMVIELETSTDEDQEKSKPQPSIALLFIPGILYMSLLFMAQGFSDDLWTERDQQTLRRVVVSPQRVSAFLAGKTLYGALLMLAIALVALAIGAAYFGLSPALVPMAATWAAFSGAVLLTGLATIQLHAPSQRAGTILTSALIFPLMMIGGSFFPFEAMPEWMVVIGTRTPNGWALQQLKAILQAQVELASLAVAFGASLVTLLVLFAVNVRRLRHGFVQG
jgi:ABC-type multidrug transport system permease subunit